MDPSDAVYLDNWFPRNDRVEVRLPFAPWATCTGISGDIETLAAWNGGSTQSLWALGSTGSAIKAYDVSSAATVSANAAFTALAHTGSTARYSQAMFNNLAGFYLYLCDENGVNAPCHYNGTTWATPAITGPGANTNLVHVTLFKYRLFFVEKNTLDLWYLPIDNIAGTALKFRLGGFCNEGGSILATANWTVDAGEGVDDRFVVVTTMGQVLIFEGTDPSSASSWNLAGIFNVARPIGRRCILRYGSDLYIITTDGLYSLTSLLTPTAVSPSTAITDKVRIAFQQAARSFSSGAGWQAVYYPKGRYVLVNVPQGTAAGSVTHQYVMNAETKAWCRFKDQNARCWGMLAGDLYFGMAGGLVRQADSTTATADANTTAIAASAKQAFNYFNARGNVKKFNLVRPSVQSNAANLALQTGLDIDFQATAVIPNVSSAGTSGSVWDVAAWDMASWSEEDLVTSNWQTDGGIGHAAAFVLSASVTGAGLAWYATDWVYEPGGLI
jgi:hypothetical protein